MTTNTKEKVENEALEFFNELDVNLEKKTGSSNSQSESQTLGIEKNGFIVSIDKITITADVTEENAEQIYILCDAHSPRVFMRYSNAFTLVLNIHDSAFFIQYDKLKEGINARTFRIEFNPNNVTDESVEWLFGRIFSKLEQGSKKISRIDIAFDTYKDLSQYRFVPRGTKTSLYYGVKGDVETLYHGSSTSERQCRLYNKKQQLRDVFGVNVEEEHYWRFEIQLRHKRVEKWREMLHNVSMVKMDFGDVTFVERCVLESLVRDSSGFDELSKNSRTKYKKLLEEKTTSNLTAQMQAVLNSIEDELAERINYWVEGY